MAKLTYDQETALEYAASEGGGWPRAKANERSYVIRSYRALERRGLVVEIPQDAQEVNSQWRLHFVITEAGRRALENRDG
jgi:hypothetical protein